MPSTAMLQTKVGTFLKAARSAWILSGICCAAITSIEIANANAASIKVSSRVICIPRNRNPRNRGKESRSAGTADAISSFPSVIALKSYFEVHNPRSQFCARSFICRESYATQRYLCKDFLTFVFYFLISIFYFLCLFSSRRSRLDFSRSVAPRNRGWALHDAAGRIDRGCSASNLVAHIFQSF